MCHLFEKRQRDSLATAVAVSRGGYKFMVAVGSRSKQFKVENRVWCDVGAFQTALSRIKTEDFSGDPRSGSSAKGFIGFGAEGAWWSSSERTIAKNKSSRSGKQLGEFVIRGFELRSLMNLG